MEFGNLAGRDVLIDGSSALDVARASGGRFGPDLAAVYEAWDGFRDWAATVPVDGGVEVVPADTVDWEVELVVVIGRRADRVTESEAWWHMAGLSVGQDLSECRVQFAAGVQFSLGKSYRGFGPIGPWLVTPDEFGDPDDLALGCTVDGETVQDRRTSELVFDVPSLIAQLSEVLPLLPGDVVFRGTPVGVGQGRNPPRFLTPGDVLETWVEGIGRIRTTCVAPPPAPPAGT
jgi:2-keto-4-pentenoate hydratase/2-oxohepta-3-ene-1,7-dioic acid hydratase in catechol pathway